MKYLQVLVVLLSFFLVFSSAVEEETSVEEIVWSEPGELVELEEDVDNEEEEEKSIDDLMIDDLADDDLEEDEDDEEEEDDEDEEDDEKRC